MADTFNTTRTPGSLSNTYDLASHVASADPHSQYLKKDDYTSYVKPSVLNGYYTKEEIDGLLRLTGAGLYHDPASDSSEYHAASMKAANIVYNLIAGHTTQYAQTASLTGHLDDTGNELYAHRIHHHAYSDLTGVASSDHNHDDRYSLIDHTHDDRYAFIVHSHNYLSATDLTMYGLYQNTVDASTSESEYDFDEETTQGNYSISSTVFDTALNKPNIGTPSSTSFLSVLVRVSSDESESTYKEKDCVQTLTTDRGVYYRIGHSSGGETEEWVFTEWGSVSVSNKNIFEVFYSCSTTPPPGAFPLWTGEWIRDCATLYPDFYNKAIEYKESGSIRVFDNDTYESTLTTYGQCGAFVIDGNDIRLPKIVNWIKGFSEESGIGFAMPAGVPNITVDFSHSGSYYGYDDGYYTGAIRFKANKNVKTLGDAQQSSEYPSGWTFDASRCSSVYGAANTVQPPSVQLALYIQVYNTVVPPAISTTGATTYTLTNNSVKFSKTMFTKDSWVENSDGDYVCTLLIESEPILHVYKTESNVATIVDTSVEIRSSNNGEQATIQLVSSTAFDGYITILEV